MKKIVHYIGLDVHKETIAVSIAKEPIYSLRFRRRSKAMARQAPGGAGK